MRLLRDPLLWLAAVFIGLLVAMPHSEALFHWLFPQQPRPVYLQETFINLALAHLRGHVSAHWLLHQRQYIRRGNHLRGVLPANDNRDGLLSQQLAAMAGTSNRQLGSQAHQ